MGERLPFEEAFCIGDDWGVIAYEVTADDAAGTLDDLVATYYVPEERESVMLDIGGLNGLDVTTRPVPMPAVGTTLVLPLTTEEMSWEWEKYVISEPTLGQVARHVADDLRRDASDLRRVPEVKLKAEYLWGRVVNAGLRARLRAFARAQSSPGPVDLPRPDPSPEPADDEAVGRIAIPARSGRWTIWVPYAAYNSPPASVVVAPATTLTEVVGLVDRAPAPPPVRGQPAPPPPPLVTIGATVQLRMRAPRTADPGERYLAFDARDWIRRYGGLAGTGWLTQYHDADYLLPWEWGEGCLKTCRLMLGLVRRSPGPYSPPAKPEPPIVRMGLALHDDNHRPDVTAGASQMPEGTVLTGASPDDAVEGYNRAARDSVSREQRALREDERGHVIPDPIAYERLLGYLEDQLCLGHPVIVGVSLHRDDDAVKDHYVVIVAKGFDAEGEYWVYYDPAVSRERDGANVQQNRFRRKAAPPPPPPPPPAPADSPPADAAPAAPPAHQGAHRHRHHQLTRAERVAARVAAARPGVLYDADIHEWGDALFYEVAEYYRNREDIHDFERWVRARPDMT